MMTPQRWLHDVAGNTARILYPALALDTCGLKKQPHIQATLCWPVRRKPPRQTARTKIVPFASKFPSKENRPFRFLRPDLIQSESIVPPPKCLVRSLISRRCVLTLFYHSQSIACAVPFANLGFPIPVHRDLPSEGRLLYVCESSTLAEQFTTPPIAEPCFLTELILLAARIKKNKKVGNVKFKVRCQKHLYTLVLKDSDKAEKLKQSLPPSTNIPIPAGRFLVPRWTQQDHSLTRPCSRSPVNLRGW
jgi:hypothetical protein